mgnify:FL=1
MQSCKNLFPACKLFAPQQENSPGRLWKRDKTRHTMPAPGQTICQAIHNRPVVFFPAAEQASWKPRRSLRAGLCNYAENPASYIRGWVFCLEILFTVLSEKGHSDSLFFRGSRRRRTRIRPRCGRRSICYSISSRLDEAGTSFCFGSVTRRTPSAYAALMPAASMPEISKLLA